MHHLFTLQIILNWLLLCDKHTVRHGGCKSEGNIHTCTHGAETLEDKAVKTSPCNAVGYSGAIKGLNISPER